MSLLVRRDRQNRFRAGAGRGPSAEVTLAVALVSALTGQVARGRG